MLAKKPRVRGKVPKKTQECVSQGIQGIPFPSSMVVEKNILTFEFESPAQARDAFAELKKQGLQLEADLEPVQAVVPMKTL